MIEIQSWLESLLSKLQPAFGKRLLFTGLQGSYRRGEATESSDIDIVVILDKLDMASLNTYRDLIHTMPEYEKACGFISGLEELQSWPRHELFQLYKDTLPVYGNLKDLTGPVRREDISRSVSIGVSSLYHLLCHTWLYGTPEGKTEILRAAYKSALFILQAVYYLRTGEYVSTAMELTEVVQKSDREIILSGLALKKGTFSPKNPQNDFEKLIQWSSGLLKEFRPE